MVVSPPRGRSGDTATITGEGFSATGNTVTFGGLPATVGVESTTSITVTVPGGLTKDAHAHVVVTNTGAETFEAWWWVKADLADLPTYVLPVKTPGSDEIERGLSVTDMRFAEAKYFERLAGLVALIPQDLLNAKGVLVGMHAAGLARVAAGTSGQVLTSYPAGPAFAARTVQGLRWGRQLAAGTTSATRMEAGGVDSVSTVTETKEFVFTACRLNFLNVFCRSSATSRVDTIEVLVNGVVEFTEVLDVGIRVNQSVTVYPNLALAAGDYVEVRITKVGTATAWLGRAYAGVA